MNRPEISRTRRFSLNSRMCRTPTTFWLATATPISVAVSSPDSGCRMFEAAKLATTTISARGLSRNSGTHCRCMSRTSNPAPSAASTAPMTTVFDSASSTAVVAASTSPARTASNTRTASTAPIGSIRMPSHFSVDPT